MSELADFKASAAKDAYVSFQERTADETAPNTPHTHPFDVRILVLDGTFGLTCVGHDFVCYRAGEEFTLLAHSEHQESFPVGGCRWIVGTRPSPVR